jgi:hypothetical protein
MEGIDMKSFIKIYGPPVYEAVKALEKMAIDMPEVCIMDTSIFISQGNPINIPGGYGPDGGPNFAQQYFVDSAKDMTWERCGKIISKSGHELGEHDFFFEWFTTPTMDQLNKLIMKIDEVLTPLNVKYTITTK